MFINGRYGLRNTNYMFNLYFSHGIKIPNRK